MLAIGYLANGDGRLRFLRHVSPYLIIESMFRFRARRLIYRFVLEACHERETINHGTGAKRKPTNY